MRAPTLFLALALVAGCQATAAGTLSPGASAAPSAGPSGAEGAAPSAAPSAASPGCDADFTAFDTSKDGELSLDEYVEGRWGQLRFVKAPTEQEIADAKARFRADAQKADASGDGRLSLAEFRTTCR